MINIYFLLGFMLLVNLIIGTGCNASVNIASNTSSTFTNQTGGFTLDKPADWASFELPDGQNGDTEVSGILTKYSQDYPTIYIAQKSGTSPSIDEAIKWGEARIFTRYSDSDEVDSYQLSEPEFFIGNDNQVARRIYTITFKDNNYETLKKEDIYLVAEDELFIFTYSSPMSVFDNHIDTFHNIFYSFRLIDD